MILFQKHVIRPDDGIRFLKYSSMHPEHAPTGNSFSHMSFYLSSFALEFVFGDVNTNFMYHPISDNFGKSS